MGEWGAMTSRRRGMQGCGDGPERSNGSAHDARSLAGGAYDTEPAQRRSGRVRRRTYAESGGGPDGPLSARDGDQSRPGRRADSRATGRSAHMMAGTGEEVSGRSNRSVHGPT